jgi:tetratricopeptide (TPR) repeat protein
MVHFIIARFCSAAGNYYCYTKYDLSTGMQFFEKALESSNSGIGDDQPSIVNLNIAQIKYRSGDYPAAQQHANEAQRLAKSAGNLLDEARALRIEATCCMELGNYGYASFLFHRAGELVKLCGMSGGTLDHLNMAGEAEVYRLKSEYAEAKKLNMQIAENTSAEEDPYMHASALSNMAEIDITIGTAKQAVRDNLDKAKIIFQKLEYQLGVTQCEMNQGDLKLRDGDILRAKALFKNCLESSWGKDATVVSYCLERLADVGRWQAKDFSWSSTWTVIYLAHAKRSKEKLAVHKALLFLGDVFFRSGDKDTAGTLFIVALDGFSSMDIHRSRADCMLRLGDLAKESGDISEATTLWKRARPLFERSLQKINIAQVDIRLAAEHHL